MNRTERNTTSTGLSIIQIGFFKTNSCFQKYGHVELRFSDYTVTSITQNPGVVHILKDKKMSNPNYSCFFEIAVEPEVEESMIQFAHEYPKQFSVITMYFNFLPILKNYPRRTGTFCSEYICCLLQVGGFCESLDSYRTSPDDLFNELRFDDRVVCSRNKSFF